MELVRPAQSAKIPEDGKNFSALHGIYFPYSITQYQKGQRRQNKNLVRPAQSIGYGYNLMFFPEGPEFGLTFWNNSWDEIHNWKLDTDSIGVFFWDNASAHIPSGGVIPDWVYWEENITTSPSLEDFQRMYYNTKAHHGINRRHQDTIFHIDRACLIQEMKDIKKSAEDTGFVSWLDTQKGLTVWKGSQPVIFNWVRGGCDVNQWAHRRILDQYGFVWDCV